MADNRYYTLIDKYLNLKEDFGEETYSKQQDMELFLLSCAILLHNVKGLTPEELYYAQINTVLPAKSKQIAIDEDIYDEQGFLYGAFDINSYNSTHVNMNGVDENRLKSFINSHFDKSDKDYYRNFNRFIPLEEVVDNILESFLLWFDRVGTLNVDFLKERLSEFCNDINNILIDDKNLPWNTLNSIYHIPTKSFFDRFFAKKKAIKLKFTLTQIMNYSFYPSINCYLELALAFNPPPWREFNKQTYVDILPPPVPYEPPVPQLTYTEEELYKIIKSRIHVRKSLIQNRCFAKIIISDEAETEIAILSCAILMFYIPENQNDYYIEIENGMIPILMNMAYSNRLWNHVDSKFIEKRLAEYIEEIKQCLSEEETDLPYKSYYYLFNQPLAKKLIQQDFDDSEVAKFRDVLKKIVHEHSEVFNRVCIDFINYKLITKPLLKREAFTSLSQN